MSNVNFRFRVGVFRHIGYDYTRVSIFAVTSMRLNSSETQGCAVMSPTSPQLVQEGDRLAVFVRRVCGNGVCPLQPNLRAASPISVFFTRAVSVTAIPMTQLQASGNYTNVYLDVSASIGEYIFC